MHSQKLLTLILFVLSISAHADFRTITEAYEVDLGDMRLPGTANGTLNFKQCSDCESQTLRVNSTTRYLINGRDFALADFKAQLRLITNQEYVSVSVLHHLESNTIKAVKVRH